MDFFDVLNKRQSIRKFKGKEIEKEKIEKLLDAVNSAPSAGNLQAYEVFLVRDEGKKAALADAALGQDFVAEAPIVLVFFANQPRAEGSYGVRGRELYSIQDATIAAAYSQLAAAALGLGSCWVGAFDDGEVKRVLGIEEGWQPVAIIPIGYAAEKPSRTPKRRLQDIIHKEG